MSERKTTGQIPFDMMPNQALKVALSKWMNLMKKWWNTVSSMNNQSQLGHRQGERKT
jgi:hypothetical protein